MLDNKIKGVILVNLGTPDAPTASAIRRYLKVFLADRRVVEIPRFIWFWILHLLILPFRPKRIVPQYQKVWKTDSPIREISQEQVRLVQEYLDDTVSGQQYSVKLGMTYGSPAFMDTLTEMVEEGVNDVTVLPMYPQYSGSTTAAVFDQVAKWSLKQRNLPALHFIKDYYDHPDYIKALVEQVQEYQQKNGKADKLLFSFHGIPKRYEDLGDPYGQQCKKTARLLAEALKLEDAEWEMGFQSRFGRAEWLQPYISSLLDVYPSQGIQRIQVLCPGFSADCLETLEEISEEYKALFLSLGGESFEYIPALNSRSAHIKMIAGIVSLNR